MIQAEPRGTQPSRTNETLQVIQGELEEVEKTINDSSVRLEQSRIEVDKVSHRNTAVTTHLQSVQLQKDDLSTEEIRQAYSSALETQQRLFVMREQIGKLQNDLSHLKEKKEFLIRLQSELTPSPEAVKSEADKLGSVEMMINVQEAERQKLSRQMHDGPAQAISNFILQTDIALRLMDTDVNQARAELGNLKSAAMSTFQKVRNYIFELRPMMLDDLGLIPTIRRYAETFKEQTGIDVNVTVTGRERRLDSYVEVLLFRGLQELLGYAVHQNLATSVKIFLDLDETIGKLTVDDNGRGFDPEAQEEDTYLGLKLLKDRVEFLGGAWVVDSSPGSGSRLTCSVPLKK